MFTGIVEALGEVVALQALPDQQSRRLVVASRLGRNLHTGDSVAVQGCCLTVVEHGADRFAVELSPTTLELTTLGRLLPGQAVNLERAATPRSRLGGHWVQGHVDGQGRVQAREAVGAAVGLTITFPPAYAVWVVTKGSVAVDGVSLTVVDRGADAAQAWLSVTLIPHTLKVTTLGRLDAGDAVNLEFDVLGKYLAQLLEPYRDLLAQLGPVPGQPTSGGQNHA